MAGVKFTLEYQDKASAQVKKLNPLLAETRAIIEKQKKATAGTTKATQDLSKSYEDLKKKAIPLTAAVAGVGFALKKTFDLSEQGAQIRQTGESFDLLMQKVGAGPTILNQLKSAAGGTIPTLNLMSSTSALLAGTQGKLATSLAKATPELLLIARAANKLNPALGSVEQQYQSLALGVKRASPLILDNLGLTIRIGEANEKYAAMLGKSVEALTAEEQKQALLNETLRAGKVLIDQVGGSVESLADPYSVLRANTENLTNSFKAWISQALGPAVTAASQLVQMENILNAALDTGVLTADTVAAKYRTSSGELLNYAEAVEYAAVRQSEQNQFMERGAWTAEAYAMRTGLATESITEMINVMGEPGAQNFVDTIREGAVAFDDINTNLGSYIENLKDTIEWQNKGGDALQGLVEGMHAAAVSGQDLGNGLDIAGKLTKGLERNSAEAIAVMQGITPLPDAFVMSIFASADTLQDVLDRLNEINGMMVNASVSIDTKYTGGNLGASAFAGDIVFGPELTGPRKTKRASGKSSTSGLIGGMATGGKVKPGDAVRVGELGPELFIADRAGEIISNNGLKAAGGVQGGGGNISIQTVNIYGNDDPAKFFEGVEREAKRRGKKFANA